MKSTSLRTGKDYLESLNDGRKVFFDGELVDDVAKHPAFRGAARSIARLYDIAAEPENREVMTFTSPKTGRPVHRCYQIPKTHADLRARRLFSEKWAEATFGLMGRTPDHVAGFFCGFATQPSFFSAAGKQFGENIVRLYEEARDNQIFISYAVVPPQIDRSKPAHKQSDPSLYAGVVEERDGGIVISGAQQLATAGVYSDWLHLSYIQPCQPGDENYANGLVVPINAPGLKLYPRRAFARADMKSIDYPLSNRFDETDSYVVFDNVFVPWDNVYCYRNIEICRNQWHVTPAHAYGNLQAQIRYAAKLRFMMGLAKRMNEHTGHDSNPAVHVAMGELAALASIVESMAIAQEVLAVVDAEGILWPSRTTLYAVMALQSEFNGRMIESIRELSGSAMITLPSSAADFDNPDIAQDLERYMCSASSDAKTRMAFLRLLWDFIGSEFGGRQQQYEKFYGGAPHAVRTVLNRLYDHERATALVDSALALPPVGGPKR